MKLALSTENCRKVYRTDKHDEESMERILTKLISRINLTSEEVTEVSEIIANGNGNECQISAFLTLLASKGETVEEISSMAKVMRNYSARISISNVLATTNTVDIVGTGGDGFNTVNISTASSILTAACGTIVTKHGSTSVSSLSGSSDVLLELMSDCDANEAACHINQPKSLIKMVDEVGYCFFYAPYFHPAMKHVVPIRKALKVRTVFNILGPLLNPLLSSKVSGENHDSKSKFSMVLGVYSADLLETYAEVIKSLGVDHALVVHGSGMDELNTCGIVQAYEVIKDKPIQKLEISPLNLGLQQSSVSDLRGGSPRENATIIKECFKATNDRTDNGKYDKLRETIALNTAAALYVSGASETLEAGLAIALAVLRNGKAIQKLNDISKSWRQNQSSL